MANAKILIVEDDRAVAKDIEEKLETLGYTVLPTVSSGVQAIAKVAEMRPDLILIDIGLEGKMDGVEVASEIYNRFNIPVVYLTDYVNEDLLEKVRTTRAFGHVFKPYGIEQLHLSIENHIYWYEEDQKYRQGEQWFSTVLGNVGDGVIATDQDGLVTFMNPAAESMTGWQLEAAAKLDIKQIFRTDAGEDCPITVALTHIRHTGTTPGSASSTAPGANHNAILTAKSGRKIHIDYNAVPSNNVEGEPIGTVITFRDSTEYKAIEEELNQTVDQLQSQTQLMEAVFDSICDGVIAIDTDGQYLMVNSKAQETTGGAFPTYAPIDERPKRYGLFHPDGKTLFSGDELPLTRAMRGETTDNIEMFVCNDDQPEGAFINVSGRPLRDKQGTLKGGVVVFHDYTELKAMQTELEQTIDELSTQTQLMGTVFDSMADGIIVTDADGNLLLSNQKAAQVFNLEIMTLDLLPSVWAERGGLFEADKETYLPTDRNPLLQALRGEMTDDVEVFVRNRLSPDGIHLNVNGRPLLNTDNEVTAGVVIFRDTTKDKEAAGKLEQTISELRNQTQLMETVFNGINDGLVVADTTGEILISNPSIRRMFNMDGVEASPSKWAETYGIFYPDKETYVPVDQLPLLRAIRGEEVYEKEFFIHNENKGFGSYISASATPLRSVDNQEIIGGVGIIRDITRRKEAEIELKQALQEQQEQTQLMETVFNTISDAVVAADTEGRYLMSNTKAQETLGPILDSVSLADRPKYYGLFHADGKTLLSGDELPLTCALRGETTDNIEILVSNDRRDDEIFINVSGRPLLDAKGTLKGGVIVFHDITEIKAARATLEQTVNELRSQTQLMETVVNSMNEGLIVSNPEGQVLFTNPSVEQMFGVLEAPDLPISEWSKKCGIFYPDKKTHVPIDQIMKSLESILGDRQLIEEEFFIRNKQHPDGVNILSSVVPLRDESQQVTGWVNVIRDITKDKTAAAELTQMMTQLQEQAQLMETVFNSVSDGVVVTNEKGEFLLVNPSAMQITGMGPTDAPPDQWSERYGTFYPDKVTRVPTEELPLVQAMQGQITDGIDLFLCNHENPEGVFINVSGRPLQGEHDNVRGGVIVFRDVTKIKNTEARLEQTVEELRDQTRLMDIVFNSISDGVVVMDEKGQFIRANPAVDQMTGPPVADIELNRASEQYGAYHPTEESLMPVDDLPIVQAVNGIATDNVEMRIKAQELSDDLYLSVSGRPLLDEEGILRGGVAVARDITELKRTENQLKTTITQLENQTQLMETVFNSISDGVVVGNTEGKYFMFNAAAKRMTGRNMQPTEMQDIIEQVGFFLPDEKTPFPDDQLPIARVLRGEMVNNVEMFMYNPSTMEAGIHLSVSASPLYDAQGVLTGGVSVSRDVTTLKQTEQQLRKSVTQLEHQTQLMDIIFNSISDGVVVCDENGNYIMVNPAAEHMVAQPIDSELNYASDQYGLFQADTDTLFPVEELPLARAVKGESTDNIAMRIQNPELPGGVYVSVSGSPLFDAKGRSRGGVVVARDITELKHTENQLRESIGQLEHQTQLMESIFNSISDGVVVADEKGQFTMFNPSAERIVGMGAVEVDPDDWSDQYGLFFHDRVTPFPPEELPLALALNGQAVDDVELFVRNPNMPDGAYISVNARPLQAAGEISGGVAVFRDVTERVLADEALAQAFAQGRLEIVDTILHNIGNAINSVSAGVDILHEHVVNDRLIQRFNALATAVKSHQADWVNYIQNDPQGQKVLPFVLALAEDFSDQNEQLRETVERVRARTLHIVDIVRTQKSFDNVRVTAKDIGLRQAISDALKLQQDSIDKRGIQVDIDCANAPTEIRIQESQFNQMLVNLIKNSIEAIDQLVQSSGLNEPPRIEIRAYIDEAFFNLDVTDNGIGISEKEAKVIFTAGYTTKETGSGLGLHSIANFVAGKGGHIQPLSEGKGKGATMRVRLRLASIKSLD